MDERPGKSSYYMLNIEYTLRHFVLRDGSKNRGVCPLRGVSAWRIETLI
jgi:hypothetical protein